VLDALRQAGMTRREAEVLMLIAEGKTNDEIAEQLYLSIRTVERHISTIYQKLGVSGRSARAAAASYAVKAGISTSS
jgi:DNA-binding NarL/FixJ family response regulator